MISTAAAATTTGRTNAYESSADTTHTVDGRYDTDGPKRVNVARLTVRQRRVPNTAAVMYPPLHFSALSLGRRRRRCRSAPRETGRRYAVATARSGRLLTDGSVTTDAPSFPVENTINTKYGTHRVTGIRTNLPLCVRVAVSNGRHGSLRTHGGKMSASTTTKPIARFNQRQRFDSRRNRKIEKSLRRLTFPKKKKRTIS